MGLAGLSSASLRETIPCERDEFGDLRRVPERDKGAAVPRYGESNRVGRRHDIALRQVEAFVDRASSGIEQNHIVGEIFGDQQLLMTGVSDHSNCGWIRHALVAVGSGGQAGLSSLRERLDRQRNQPLRRDLSRREAVNRDAAAYGSLAVALGIGHRSHTGVEVAAVAAEGKARVERLLGDVRQCAVVGKVGERSSLGVQNRERLVVLRFECPVAGVHRHHVAAIG